MESITSPLIGHCSIGVKNYEQSCRFYKETLSILYPHSLVLKEGIYPPVQGVFPGVRFTNFIESNSSVVFCVEDLTYGIKDPLQPHDGKSPKGVHFAFSASSPEAVHSWYKKALELGAQDNGAPGPRPHYPSSYYGAFVIDPSGYRIEACLPTYSTKP